MEIHGRSLARQQLLDRIGDIAQVGGVRCAELADGRERGVRIADLRTATGLNFTVHLDRGMDIGHAEYAGQTLAWRSSTGVTGPAYYDPGGLGWLDGFAGGLLTTCGFSHAGGPCVDEDVPLGLHGPASYLPAEHVWADGAWEGDCYEVFVQGRVRQGRLYGEKIELSRRIWARLGENRLFVADRVTNVGGSTTPHMILYHCNLGFPLLDETSELLAPCRQVLPQDETARSGLGRYNRFEPPQPNYAYHLFHLDLEADRDGTVTVALVNRCIGAGRGLGLYLRYQQCELPRFTEWKMMGVGDYVLGLEPGNCWPTGGRAGERARGSLQYLEPGETREYHLEIGVLPDNAAIEQVERMIAKGMS